jgi:clan AA aspartic protease (TIGR02281 family)
MNLKPYFAAASLALGLHAAPLLAEEAAIEAMQEYMMFSEYEAGIILPQQLDQSVFETALFVDTRDAEQFEEATIPGAINIEWREVLDRMEDIPEDRMTILFCNTGSLSAQAAFALRVASRSNVVVMQTEIPAVKANESRAAIEAALPQGFSLLRQQLLALIRGERYESAYEVLLEASGNAVTPVEQDEFRRLLAEFVDSYTRALIEINQFQEVDAFYERLTLALPQYAEYQLQLGKLRIQMGNGEAALGPLAQIGNHQKFGAEARQLMAQVEQNELLDIALEILPLSGHEGQFIVEALIDERYPVKLLVDTGAAMTAIDAGVLQMAGYSLNAEQQYFVTANGVVSAPVVTLGEVSLGNARIARLPVGALPLSMPGGVVGLLGMNFLRHYDFRIDQNNRTLILDKRQ